MVALAALKVKAKWLRIMQEKPFRGSTRKKTMEVRKYLPWEKTPRGHTPLQRGERFYLLAEGEIWGSACLEDVVEFSDIEQFAIEASAHCVSEATCSAQELQAISGALGQGKKIYGWKLIAMRWFHAGSRPRSGLNGIPEFKGQARGWVWSVNRLPSHIDSPATVGTMSTPLDVQGNNIDVRWGSFKTERSYALLTGKTKDRSSAQQQQHADGRRSKSRTSSSNRGNRSSTHLHTPAGSSTQQHAAAPQAARHSSIARSTPTQHRTQHAAAGSSAQHGAAAAEAAEPDHSNQYSGAVRSSSTQQQQQKQQQSWGKPARGNDEKTWLRLCGSRWEAAGGRMQRSGR